MKANRMTAARAVLALALAAVLSMDGGQTGYFGSGHDSPGERLAATA